MILPSDITPSLPLWQAALQLAPALACAVAVLWARPTVALASVWRGARCAALVSMGAAALSLAMLAFGTGGAGFGVRADALGGVMLLLVAFVGWVIVRYSQPYLAGERDERAYARWLLTTLATVGLVAVSNHVLLLALAWTATSLALHRLLRFFGDRPAAVVAAHKKFIVARAADLCMLGAAALLMLAFGTGQIDRLLSLATAQPGLPLAAQAAVLLIACAALLKCAQLPFHGWLIQVMEAPTPVSALLHAGVVNLGGFVLMRYAPLVGEMPAAQVLLVAVGTATAVLAALVMSTRISIKVMLAWSTCAQMGFMLMQCGLGLWQMALLHLVAHSLYKAHAFLGAGGVVRRTQQMQLAPRATAPGAAALAVGGVIGLAMVLAAAAGSAWLLPAHAAAPAAWVLAGILALALVPLLHTRSPHLGAWGWPALAGAAFGVALAYFALHALFAGLVPASAIAVPTPLWSAVALAFGALFVLQSVIALCPRGALARGLYPWFYGGLFLDEAFTRVAFGLWHPPAPAPAAAAMLPAPDAMTFPSTLSGARA